MEKSEINKMKYEKPVLLNLGGGTTGTGDLCSSGSSADPCGSSGNSATFTCGPTGNSAGSSCGATGNSIVTCQSGTDAVGCNLAGSSATSSCTPGTAGGICSATGNAA